MGPVILAVVFLGVVAWIAPHLDGNAPPSGAAPSPATSSTPSPAGPTTMAARSWSSDQTIVERASDGHFYIDGTVGPQSVHFLIDTGATVVSLTGSDARAIGLTWDDADVRPIGKGASGTVYGVHTRLDNLEVGGAALTDVPAVIVPEGLDVSLLGQSALSRMGAVSIDEGQMTIGGNG